MNMTKWLVLSATFLVATIGATGFARADITLTFEGLQNNEAVANYYNGGFGGNGSGPGPNYGITFGSDSLALITSAGGGTGNFTNPPSGDTEMYFLSGSGDMMNVAAGFTTGFSFYYNGIEAGVVKVYSGLNDTGTLLASLTLPVTPNAPNVFVPIGVAFAGTAMSVDFSGTANEIGFDNITLGSPIPTVTAPEPSTLAVAGFVALCGIGYSLARKRKARREA